MRLLGFVSKEPKARGGRFELGRVYITCCVADSVPMGVTIEPADPHAPAYGRDDWLAASGQLARRGRKLSAARNPIQRAKAPRNLYLSFTPWPATGGVPASISLVFPWLNPGHLS